MIVTRADGANDPAANAAIEALLAEQYRDKVEGLSLPAIVTGGGVKVQDDTKKSNTGTYLIVVVVLFLLFSKWGKNVISKF